MIIKRTIINIYVIVKPRSGCGNPFSCVLCIHER